MNRICARFLTVMALLATGCNGDKASVTSPIPPPITAPTVAPTPAASPVAPTDPRVMKSCEKLAAGSASATCKRESPSFQAEVYEAITLLRTQKPEIFKGNTVLSSGQYVIGVIQNLDAQGLCSYWDGEELAVKNADWFSDQYDILTWQGTVLSAYMSTCYPSAFPLNLPALAGQQPDCKLPPSKEIICSKDPVSTSEYIGLVDTAIGNALVQHPEYFDFNDRAPASEFVKVVNWTGFLGAVTKELQSKGLCTFYDGEELQVKGTNGRSEHFDILLSSMHHRRGDGMYRSSCFPAAF